jgi:hypothetical protein
MIVSVLVFLGRSRRAVERAEPSRVIIADRQGAQKRLVVGRKAFAGVLNRLLRKAAPRLSFMQIDRGEVGVAQQSGAV